MDNISNFFPIVVEHKFKVHRTSGWRRVRTDAKSEALRVSKWPMWVGKNVSGQGQSSTQQWPYLHTKVGHQIVDDRSLIMIKNWTVLRNAKDMHKFDELYTILWIW